MFYSALFQQVIRFLKAADLFWKLCNRAFCFFYSQVERWFFSLHGFWERLAIFVKSFTHLLQSLSFFPWFKQIRLKLGVFTSDAFHVAILLVNLTLEVFNSFLQISDLFLERIVLGVKLVRYLLEVLHLVTQPTGSLLGRFGWLHGCVEQVQQLSQVLLLLFEFICHVLSYIVKFTLDLPLSQHLPWLL